MLWIRWHQPSGNRNSTDSPEKVLVSQTSSSFFYASMKNSQDVQCVNDNRIWLLCLNPPLEPRGKALRNQPVQSSPIAWRALCGGELCLCQSCSHSARCEGLWASNISATSQKMLQEAELYLPAPLHCSRSFMFPSRMALSSWVMLCCQFDISDGQYPKGQNQTLENEVMKTRVFFWNYRSWWLTALGEAFGSITGSFLCYKSWTKNK